jgi:hypothetical protein
MNVYKDGSSVPVGMCLCESPTAWNKVSGKCDLCQSGYIDVVKDGAFACGN